MTDATTAELDALAAGDVASTGDDVSGATSGQPPDGALFDTEPMRVPEFIRVCDALLTDGSVCGFTVSSDDAEYAENDNPAGSARAAWARHRRFEHPKDGGPAEPAKKTRKRAPREKAPTQAASAQASSSSSASRAEQYAGGIAGLALFAWLTPGVPIDDFDLSVLNAGAPTLANALDGLGDRHAIVRQACDLVLVGGGGPYTATLMAVLAIAGPIAAHHGFLPADVGARFGTLIGVLEVPSPEPRPVPPARAPTTPGEGPAAPADDTDTGAGYVVDPGEAIAAYLTDPPTPGAAFTPMTGDGPVDVNGGVSSADAAAFAPA